MYLVYLCGNLFRVYLLFEKSLASGLEQVLSRSMVVVSVMMLAG